MSFSLLPEEIKIIIFNLLDLGSRYNASLVWEEMATETLKSVPTSLCHLKRNYGIIDNIHDLEIAGVLTSAGLDALETLHLYKIDVTNVPINIVNNLAKKARYELRLEKVNGFCFPMLDNIKAQELYLKNMFIPKQVPQGVNINGNKIYLGKTSKKHSKISGIVQKGWGGVG